MRVLVLLLGLTAAFGLSACMRTNAWSKTSAKLGSELTSDAARPAASEAKPSRIDFSTQIKPILQAKCQPCHFSGGKVYAQMPFDRPATIKTLGTKLFTRIKDENERRMIREFLATE